LRRASQAVLVVLATREPPGAMQLAAAAPRAPNREELARWRGRIDAHALMARFSDPDAFARLAPQEGPERILFAQLEQARVDALGSSDLPGMRANLAAWHAVTTVPIGAAPLRAARDRFGAPSMRSAEAQWRSGVTGHATELIEAMAVLLADQSAFARLALRLVAMVAEGAPDEPAGPRGAGSAARPAAMLAANPEAGGAPLDSMRALIDQPRGLLRTELAGLRPATSRYRAYTRRFDRVCEAHAPDATQLAALSPEIRRFANARANFARWARRLQQHLLGRQERAWLFDLPEGVIDGTRLSRVVTAPCEPLLFKREASTKIPLAAVTMLIDCSGSMRGTPIATAAGCADLLASVFELCRVRFEILGFSTREWQGGRSRQQWLLDGRPRSPGRLTDLEHIVFKDGDLGWRRTRPRLLAMLDEGLLKENVDGEALLWAFERLRRRSEPRRLLVVISDGAPRDDSTAAVNDPGYLERHLREVITAIESSSSVELLAIGIGHNVGAYYFRSFTVTGPENLGETLVRQLIPLLQARMRRGSARERAR